ncbi:hypothetical protein MNBD_CHLOROFLEXI01-3422 [hydrothermal vent metagenome]|uniref:CcmH/CycL/Ccl2/NrfF N-terminal domain-containing protein n=1 Tax=hydrothermal vent metagenome TaxID=652676 RepID=A0A3B0VSG8_9ZZZZ
MFDFLRMKHLRFVMLLLGFLLLVTPALAQDNAITDDEVNEVAKELYCPVCESTPLDVCPTLACADWRELIRQQLSEGKTEGEIFDYFARQYGDSVLASPPKQGFSLILWLFPVLAVVLGGVFFSRFMQSLRASAAGKDVEQVMRMKGKTVSSSSIQAISTTPSQPLSKDDYKVQLEEELRNR